MLFIFISYRQKIKKKTFLLAREKKKKEKFFIFTFWFVIFYNNVHHPHFSTVPSHFRMFQNGQNLKESPSAGGKKHTKQKKDVKRSHGARWNSNKKYE